VVSRPHTTLVLLAAVAILTGACGASTGIRDEGFQRPAEQLAALGPPVTRAPVFFVRYGGVVERRRRMLGKDSGPKEAIESLLAGLTPREQAGQYATAIPAGTQLLSLSLDSPTGTATVDLFGPQQLLEPGAAIQRQLLLTQIVATLTAFPAITTVSVQYDGLPVTLYVGQGPVGSELLKQPLPYADTTQCDAPPRTRVASGPALTVTTPTSGAAASGAIAFAGATSLDRGAIIVQLVTDGLTVRALTGGLYNEPQPDGSTAPCRRFSGRLVVPFGITGPATLVVSINRGPATAPSRLVRVTRPVILQ
jgi:hypothetical protein